VCELYKFIYNLEKYLAFVHAFLAFGMVCLNKDSLPSDEFCKGAFALHAHLIIMPYRAYESCAYTNNVLYDDYLYRCIYIRY